MNPKTATPTLKAYRELKLARVNEMKELMKEERKLLKKTLKIIPEFRSTTITFLTKLADLMDVKKADEAKLRIYALDIVDKLTEQGMKTVFGNLSEVPQSYRIFAKEQFENSMKDYMGAAKAIFGGPISKNLIMNREIL